MKKTMLSFGRIGRRSRLWRGISLALASVMLFCSTFVYLSVKVEAATDIDSYETDALYYRVRGLAEEYTIAGNGYNDLFQVHVGDIIDVLAVVHDPDVDSLRECVGYGEKTGTGFVIAWNNPLTQISDTEWESYDNDMWLGKTSFMVDEAIESEYPYNISLAIQKNGASGNEEAEAETPRMLLIDNIFLLALQTDAIPDDAIGNIGKFYIKTPTGFQCVDKLGNSRANAYPIYMGEEIEVGILVKKEDAGTQSRFNTFTYTDFNDNKSDKDGRGIISYTILQTESTGDDRYSWITARISADGDGYGLVALPDETYGYASVFFAIKDSSEPEMIYYRVNGQGDFIKNETDGDHRLNLTEGDVVEVYALQQTVNSFRFTVHNNDGNPYLDRVNQYGTVKGSPDDEVSDTTLKRTTYFKAKDQSGQCEIVIVRTPGDSPVLNYLYVKVFPKPVSKTISIANSEKKETYHFYVNTALGEQSKDRVHEYLAGVYADGEHVDDKYLANESMRDINRYWMNLGDTTEIALYVPADERDQGRFATNSESLNISGISWSDPFDGGDGQYRKVTLTVQAIASTNSKGATITYHKDSSDTAAERMYFEVYAFGDNNNSNNNANHLDIEISDGGTYTDTTTIYYADGTKVEITALYDAMVSGVNSCKIRYKDGAPYGDALIPAEEYGQHSTEASEGQTEYTSAYKVQENSKVNDCGNGLADVEGGPAFRNIPRAYIESVTFDVKLTLTLNNPATQIIVTKNGQEVTDQDELDKYMDKALEFIVQGSVDLKSVDFILEGQSLTDALNKCPNRFGLDFTLAKSVNRVLTETDLQVLKNFKGGDIASASQNPGFIFELYDDNNGSPGRLLVAKNVDIDGNAFFNNEDKDIDFLNFTESDVGNSFVYYIKERIPADRSDRIIYDNSRVRVDITVGRNESGDLYTEVQYTKQKLVNGVWQAAPANNGNVAEFTNSTSYQLPESGGGGVFPYMFGGGLLMTIAIIFLSLQQAKGSKVLRHPLRKNNQERKTVI